jgi:hypothetical protein
MRINFSALVGSNSQYFTFFQFFGPIAASFLGPTIGIASILFAELIDFVVSGKAFDPLNILRLAPMLFATFYFAKFAKKQGVKDFSIIICLICIAVFVLNPVGMQAWYYSLFWTIPILAKLFSKNLFLRSLGATFTAHAIGGAIWVWTVPMTAQQYFFLIPITTVERIMFAFGITISFFAFNNLLSLIEARTKTKTVFVEKEYLLKQVI